MEQEEQILWGTTLFSLDVKEDQHVRHYKWRLLVLITLLTGLLMWTYSFISLFFVDNPTLAQIGFSCSIVHAFSPLIYRWSRSMSLAAYSMVTSGMIFQFSFSYFTGGFFSPTLIWFAVLPLIVGLLTSRVHAVFWTFLSVGAYMLMFLLQSKGLVPESSISELGRTLAQFMIGLGLIGLVGGFTVFFLELAYFYHHKPKDS
ncbi:hypothetical protein [Bdellovibrio bacteriovorus]|uniref:Uncharacterized protein n=1 Tax=Bdellovibrio bacteriovorus str. Tiberius TaxID=1069642 RepID=K7YSC7_BDEBC|nr:hypothetical protein [Bdellovibrio bacteriovorus]AFY00513.1 hypothetical protein Bdt_0807 [Bdellovibrio bacteriovorus str. Tiberius]